MGGWERISAALEAGLQKKRQFRPAKGMGIGWLHGVKAVVFFMLGDMQLFITFSMVCVVSSTERCLVHSVAYVSSL